MLFNSYNFIFMFLIPVVFLYSFVPYSYRTLYLSLVSVIFYLQWNLFHLMILLFSISVNYFTAYWISKSSRKKMFLVGGLLFNLGLLSYFKYSGLLGLTEKNVVLPLAISFFTFQQIAYLVDIYRHKITFESFEKYIFFVLFFPQLVVSKKVLF